MTKTVYLYDANSFLFCGEYQCQLSPLEPEIKDEEGKIISEAKYIEPHFSTEIAPPKVKENEIAQFHPDHNAWNIVKDYRGQIFYDKDSGEEIEIKILGEIPANLVSELPEEIINQRTINRMKMERVNRIHDVNWRYERNAREIRLGLPPSDDIKDLDIYIQALCDVPNQKGFPNKIKWPELKVNKS